MTAQDVDEFLADLPEDAREALQQLREVIRAIIPDATEVISYGVPTFKLNGKSVVGFGAAKTHCSLYVMSTAVTEAHAAALAGYSTGKGTVRFAPGGPLPVALVEKLVKARLAENEAGRRR